jgi:ABC-type siderophore export system fused ATPase/permease subunit
MLEEISSLLIDAIKAVVSGSRKVRVLFFVACALIATAIILGLLAEAYKQSLQAGWLQPLAAGLGITGALVVLGIGAYRRALASTAREKAFKEVEERAREHPNEPQAAWDLARVKLESYLNRNLRHVQWIFVLTLLVMVAGFIIIGYGVFKVYQSPENFKPSIVVTVSGIFVEFIAATFLVIYRSTMEQARSYVSMLEKINAVGMSIQILDSTKTGNIDKVRTQIAMELLSLYSMRKTSKKEPDDDT